MLAKGEAAAERAKRRADEQHQDDEGSRLVRERSGGRCEWNFNTPGGVLFPNRVYQHRCWRPATEVHHLIYGNGKRGNISLGSHLPSAKIDSCMECHQWAHSHPAQISFDARNPFGTLKIT